MKKDSEKSDGRRGFLKSGLRNLFLGSIVFVSGLLRWREIHYSGDENFCAIESPCRGCSERTDCTDPKAVKSKQNIPSKQQG
ncbi:MAG TPA: hypothetical protein ENH82_01180 [bacterium]|nr:hypothetical protein [bacterium]